MQLRAAFCKIKQNKKTLARFSKKKLNRIQINKIKMKDISNDSTEIQRIRRDYQEKLYLNKLNTLEDIYKFLETNNLLG